MSGSHSIGQVVHRRQPRVLVVQNGIEGDDTLDLIKDLAPDRVETVDDVYEAVAMVGLAGAREEIDTVVVPVTIAEFSAARIVEAFQICDGRVRLVLLAPNGRTDAMQSAVDAGFDDAIEMPASQSRLSKAIGLDRGLIPRRTVEIERNDPPGDPLDRHESTSPRRASPHPTPREILERAADASPPPDSDESGSTGHEVDLGDLAESTTDTPARQLGDVDLVAAVVADDGHLRSTSLAMIRAHLGTQDVHLLLLDEAVGDDGRAVAAVHHDGEHLGMLVSSTVGAADLVPWASWLSVWMGLDRHLRGLERLAETDELTGAGNRRAFERILDETLAAARNERRIVTLMVFDIDNFKTYNDRYGHDAGDEVLRETVELLRSTIRRGDHVFRIGGDEFVVIFSDAEGPRVERSAPPESVEEIAHRFQAKVCELRFPQLGVDAEGSLSISAGLATFPWDGHDGPSLLRHADSLALESKRSGKNALRFGPGARSRCERHRDDEA